MGKYDETHYVVFFPWTLLLTYPSLQKEHLIYVKLWQPCSMKYYETLLRRKWEKGGEIFWEVKCFYH